MKEPFKAKKSLGQNFLTNVSVVKKIADAAHITPGERVLEIGPGKGILTRALLDAGAIVTALEADIRAVELLIETFAEELRSEKLILLHEDARTTDLPSLMPEGPFKVVANIPYYLTGMLFERLLSAPRKPSHIVFLVQKEVAERIARDKKESILSLSVKAYGNPSYVATVSRGNFSPAPRVDSAILKISDISAERFRNIDEKRFFKLLHLGFGARRKQLLGNLSAAFPRETVSGLFRKFNIPETTRGEDLPISTWLDLAVALCPLFPET